MLLKNRVYIEDAASMGFGVVIDTEYSLIYIDDGDEEICVAGVEELSQVLDVVLGSIPYTEVGNLEVYTAGSLTYISDGEAEICVPGVKALQLIVDTVHGTVYTT